MQPTHRTVTAANVANQRSRDSGIGGSAGILPISPAPIQKTHDVVKLGHHAEPTRTIGMDLGHHPPLK